MLFLFRVEDVAGRFLHVSGMAYAFDAKRPKGSRIVEATVAGRPLDEAKRYKVATNEYIAGGGDGYAVLKEAKTLIGAAGGALMASVVMDHIAALGEIAPAVEGRITVE